MQKNTSLLEESNSELEPCEQKEDQTKEDQSKQPHEAWYTVVWLELDLKKKQQKCSNIQNITRVANSKSQVRISKWCSISMVVSYATSKNLRSEPLRGIHVGNLEFLEGLSAKFRV